MPVEPSRPLSARPLSSRREMWRGIRRALGSDAAAGALLLAATVLALILANSPAADGYAALRDTAFGPESLHLHLTVGQWAADGLLAVFFFVVGLELKEELVAGRLRSPGAAAAPVAGALGGVIVPALVFLAVAAPAGADAARGWAIPTATDIAFAVAVFAVVARFLPPAVRVFLLTLAIVDDLVAITIIATVYTADLQPVWLAVAAVPLALFAVAVRRGIRAWWVLLPLAVVTWALVHTSGVHATVAGVALAFTVPVRPLPRARVRVGTAPDGAAIHVGMTAWFARRWSLPSALVAVPVFAFFAAGVSVGGVGGLVRALGDPVTLAIAAGLVLGKPIGILAATLLITRVPSVRRRFDIVWPDLVGVGLLSGIGFTVALLVAELSFGTTGTTAEHAKVGVLAGSTVAAVVGGTMLAQRSRAHRRAQD